MIIPELENIVQRTNNEGNRDEIRCCLQRELKRLMKQPLQQRLEYERKMLRRLVKDRERMIIQTDKSGMLAILDTEDYVQKMEMCIKEMNCKKIRKDPLTKFSNKVIDLVNKGEWPDEVKIKVRINKFALIPEIIGRIKDHKKGMPMRPIVNKRSSPTYYVEKALVSVLRDMLPESQRVVSSTKEFIDRLKDLQLPRDFIMVSFDIVSLFPSVNINKAVDYISSCIDQKENITLNMKLTLKRAVNIVVNNNFFRFNGEVYLQNQGAPMGSPISGLLAEFILRPLEDEIFTKFVQTPPVWMRYVDDIFAVWPDEDDKLNEFLDGINKIDEKIRFTMEREREGKLSYLDVLLNKVNNGIECEVYRKPMASQAVIPANACAPMTYKKAAFRSYINRAKYICRKDNIENEYENIRKNAVAFGYSKKFVDDLINNRRNKKNKSIDMENQEKKFFAIEYFPHYFERLKYKLRQYNIYLVARSSMKVTNLVRKTLDPIPKDSHAGVYEIPYINSENRREFYIGMTGRTFKKRRKEHEADIKYAKETTALARKNIKESIRILFEDSRMIYRSQEYFPSLVRETIEIMLRRDSICNDATSFILPSVWTNMLT